MRRRRSWSARSPVAATTWLRRRIGPAAQEMSGSPSPHRQPRARSGQVGGYGRRRGSARCIGVGGGLGACFVGGDLGLGGRVSGLVVAGDQGESGGVVAAVLVTIAQQGHPSGDQDDDGRGGGQRAQPACPPPRGPVRPVGRPGARGSWRSSPPVAARTRRAQRGWQRRGAADRVRRSLAAPRAPARSRATWVTTSGSAPACARSSAETSPSR